MLWAFRRKHVFLPQTGGVNGSGVFFNFYSANFLDIITCSIIGALVLDLLFGDPRCLPHPVRGIGGLALRLENPARGILRRPLIAGLFTVVVVLAATGLSAYLLLTAAKLIHPAAVFIFSMIIIYSTLSVRDMIKHSMDVYRALRDNNLHEARRRVGMIVGRDTDDLDEAGVTRACVESVAESIVDGITAPLFYAALAGPVGALLYRAVNTLDSTFGYKNERYTEFGFASARLDDIANFVPARLTAPLVSLASAVLFRRGRQSLRILRRDAGNHSSPNAGHTEAAVAGALGVQLGGLNDYFGEPNRKPLIGEAEKPLEVRHIRSANGLLLLTTFFFAFLCLFVRTIIVNFL